MKRMTFSLIFALSLVIPFSAQNTARIEPATIEGTVLRDGGNQPLSEVQVFLEGAVSPEAMQSLLTAAASAGISISPPAGASLSETTQLLTSTAAARGLPIQAPGIQNLVTRAVGEQAWPMVLTGADGKFVFHDVKPGRYTVRAVREGFFGKPVNGTYPPTAWIDIAVSEKEARQVSLALAQGAIISGRVLDINGSPHSNATVQAYSTAYQTGFALLQPALAGTPKTTDERGEYRLSWLPPGDYYIGVTPRPATGGPGTPFQAGARTFYPRMTSLNDAMPIAIRGGEELTGIDIAIRNAPLFKIAGTVTNSIPPTLNPDGTNANSTIFFHLANRDLDTPNDAPTANNAGNISLALSTGTFELANVAPGSYEVLARVADPNAGVGLGAFAWGRAIVDVADRDVRNVAITINPAVAIKGTVQPATGVAMPPNLRISLSPIGGSSRVALYTLVSARAAAAVGADGAFTVPSVPPGRFRIGSISGLPQDYYIVDVRQNGGSVFDSGFDVDTRSPEPLEVVLNRGAGVVDGVVSDGQSGIVAGAIVALVPEARRFENRVLFANATSDSSGHFVFRGVAPGDYRLFAWASTPPNAYQNAGFIGKFEARAHAVHVVQGGNVTATLALIK